MTQKACSSWESFLTDNLLQSGLVDGVCLLSKRGCKLYSQGKLEHVEEGEWKRLHDIIKNARQEPEFDKFELAVKGGGPDCSKTIFYVYNNTPSSLYAKSSEAGLVICRVPTGSIICSYAPPVINNKVILAVEKFSDLLKT